MSRAGGCAFALGLLAARVAAAEPSALDGMLTNCNARLESYDARARSARRANDILLVSGAAIAAVGSALAGFLRKTTTRKIAAVTGALGAVVAVLPKTLADPAELRATYYTAGKHRDEGVKVMAQLAYLRDPEFRQRSEQYAIARFVECTAISPMAEVPEPPQALAADTAEAEPPAKGNDDSVEAKPPRRRDAIAKPGEPRDKVVAPGTKAQASKPAKDELLGF